MSVRRATTDDLPALMELWRAFEREVPAASHVQVDHDRELREIRDIVEGELAFLAENDGAPSGFVLCRRRGPGVAYLSDLYVVPSARRGGLATALVREVAETLAEQGIDHLELEVQAANAGARVVYQRWGFVEHLLTLNAPVEQLRERLAPGRHALSFASIHVQTDDRGWVERTVAQFAPRIGSKRSRVEGPRNGWTTVYDEVADTDPGALLRFSREISDRMGAIVIALAFEVDQVVRMIALDRGGIVDEYLSVPEFYGQLPPGDVIGLAANPTVLSRLTGADPARVRAVARTAATPAELPPPRELLRELGSLLGLEGVDYGYEGP
ncbi:MAG TPA: GNAT family N-acetyltransferase [Gaiella sp.]|jgi:ribosomal protein S18 acetylase RimI-like enzyme